MPLRKYCTYHFEATGIPGDVPKYVESIFINGVEEPVTSAIELTDTVAVIDWLTSLGLTEVTYSATDDSFKLTIGNTDKVVYILVLSYVLSGTSIEFPVGISVSTCKTVFDPTVVRGCTDSAAKNYNSAATEDDASCEYEPATEIQKFAAALSDSNCCFEEKELIGAPITVQLRKEQWYVNAVMKAINRQHPLGATLQEEILPSVTVDVSFLVGLTGTQTYSIAVTDADGLVLYLVTSGSADFSGFTLQDTLDEFIVPINGSGDGFVCTVNGDGDRLVVTAPEGSGLQYSNAQITISVGVGATVIDYGLPSPYIAYTTPDTFGTIEFQHKTGLWDSGYLFLCYAGAGYIRAYNGNTLMSEFLPTSGQVEILICNRSTGKLYIGEYQWGWVRCITHDSPNNFTIVADLNFSQITFTPGDVGMGCYNPINQCVYMVIKGAFVRITAGDVISEDARSYKLITCNTISGAIIIYTAGAANISKTLAATDPPTEDSLITLPFQIAGKVSFYNPTGATLYARYAIPESGTNKVHLYLEDLTASGTVLAFTGKVVKDCYIISEVSTRFLYVTFTDETIGVYDMTMAVWAGTLDNRSVPREMIGHLTEGLRIKKLPVIVNPFNSGIYTVDVEVGLTEAEADFSDGVEEILSTNSDNCLTYDEQIEMIGNTKQFLHKCK